MINEKTLSVLAQGGYEAHSNKSGRVLSLMDSLVTALINEDWSLVNIHGKCPMCGNGAAIVKEDDGLAALCVVCGLRTAGADSEAKAWAAWDARA
jgi:hypothetical protein